MTKGLEILVVDNLSGEIYYKARRSVTLDDNGNFISDNDRQAFEAYGRSLVYYMAKYPTCVVQFIFEPLKTVTYPRIWRKTSSVQAHVRK